MRLQRSQATSRWVSGLGLLLGVAALVLPSAALGASVVRPAEVETLLAQRDVADVQLVWDPVTTDAAGNPATMDHYEVYRDTTPDFAPDTEFFTNRIGTASTEDYLDLGIAQHGIDYFYLVRAVDENGNAGGTRAPKVTTPPLLSGYWTDTTIEVDWTDAQPSNEVQSYRVYYGKASGRYEFVEDVGLAHTLSLTGLETNVNWYVAVVGVDSEGNESAFSNEHVDPVAGTIDILVHDGSELCWGAAGCPPVNPEAVQRSDGFQLLIPADFPEGDWSRVDVTLTMDSRLCEPPAGDNTTKCGSGNPCPDPPCNGGYNTCGDPWDRTAHLFLVLDDCIDLGHGCINGDNIELIRAVTPFGTDAEPPDGTGVVPPRKIVLDITPFTPLIAGERRYIGAHIGHFTQMGWWVSSEFHFSKRPEEVSPKPPAAGIETAFFHSSGAGLTGPFPVTVPPEAQQVVGRLFITGHGGNTDVECGQPADEFCPRTNRILVDSSIAWEKIPWRDCCYPRDTEPLCLGCQDWNACGWPSCTYNRSGWCPGEIACHSNLDEGCDQDLDLTNALTAGVTHDIEYEILEVNGSWSRSLVVYWYNESIEFCGNNRREGSELCDGTDLGTESCQTQGFDGGTLVCLPECDGFDTSDCRNYECGNNICELSAGEDCLSCPSDCNGVQSGNPGNRYCCGDGEGTNPVDCSDPRCTADGNSCDP